MKTYVSSSMHFLCRLSPAKGNGSSEAKERHSFGSGTVMSDGSMQQTYLIYLLYVLKSSFRHILWVLDLFPKSLGWGWCLSEVGARGFGGVERLKCWTVRGAARGRCLLCCLWTGIWLQCSGMQSFSSELIKQTDS